MSAPRRLAIGTLTLALGVVASMLTPTASAEPSKTPAPVRALDHLGLPARTPAFGAAPTGVSGLAAATTSAVTLPATLPAPTGSLPVGATTLRLVDRSRSDPWVPSSGPRRIVVSLFYPALTRGGRPWQYATAAEAVALSTDDHTYGLDYPAGVSDDFWSKVVTGAQADVLPRPELGGRPLVLLSPGLGLQRSSLTSQATDLASRGYIVALMDHTYENVGESLGNGVFTTCAWCDLANAAQTEEEWLALIAQVPRVRAADASFVLDQLLTRDLPVPCLRFIDPRRIAMVGHSIGGAGALRAMLGDRRIAAGVNLDGSDWEPLTQTVDRPFLILGTDRNVPDLDPTWTENWPRLTGFKHLLVVPRTYHTQVTDLGPLYDQIGVDFSEYGDYMSGDRAVAITRAYVAAFLDRTLRGQNPALMRGPSPAYPEVTFRDPA